MQAAPGMGREVLDAHTRNSVRAELHEILSELELPTLLVTHDFEDAAALANRVTVVVGGSVLQSGTAVELVREGLSGLAEVAARTGFADQSHLSRWARRVHGVPLTQLAA